jgi:3-oxoacyl-[acyl-carrier-protein] synthase-3
MNFTFHKVRISGLLTVLPAHERLFVDDMRNFDFPAARSLKLKEVMGYDRHRVVEEGTCFSDLAVFALEHLFGTGLLGRDDFDALVVVTQSPDHFIPPTSNVIQGRLGLKTDMLCLDVNQGCAGYLIGLMQAFLLLSQESVRRVVVVVGDVLSRKVSQRDRNSYPLIGDGLAVTVVDRGDAGPVHANLWMDGTGRNALTIPAGGFRTPSNAETAVVREVGENNYRSLDHLHMDGTAVFNFVQVRVPPMIDQLLDRAGVSKESVDYFLFHQPNRFMLHKLADKMKVPRDKMPSNVVERFGNASSATIPTAIAHNLGQRLRDGAVTACLAGFGVGLTWASMLMRLGPLDYCDLIDYPSGEGTARG